MTKILPAFVCSFALSMSAGHAKDQSIAIDSKGVTVNGTMVSMVNSDGSQYTSIGEMRAILGKPIGVGQIQGLGECDFWEGVSLFAEPRPSLLSIEFQTAKNGRYRGTVSIEGVAVTAGTLVSRLNASLNQGKFEKDTKNRLADHSFWDLKYADSWVRVACDGKARIQGLSVMPLHTDKKELALAESVLSDRFAALAKAGRFKEAIPLAAQLLAISEKLYGLTHLNTALRLDVLALA